MKLIFEVCIRWADNNDERGTYCDQLEAGSRDEAITAVAQDMAVSPEGCGLDASEEAIRAFVAAARARVVEARCITDQVFNDLNTVFADELQGRRLDPKALCALITENLERVASVANQSAPNSPVAASQAKGPDLAGVLANLVHAVDFTPLGVRGIKAVAVAKAALADVPGSGYAKVFIPEHHRFSATWSAAFANSPETCNVTAAFFTQDAGYDWEDLIGLAALKVGETWQNRHYGPEHTVTRLPDAE